MKYDIERLSQQIEEFCELMKRKGYDLNKFDGPDSAQTLQDILHEQVVHSYQKVQPFEVTTPLATGAPLRGMKSDEPRFVCFTVGYAPDHGFRVKELEIIMPAKVIPSRKLHTRTLFNNADIPAKHEALLSINTRKRGIKP